MITQRWATLCDHVEGLSTPTRILDIWILEDKLRAQMVLLPIHLTTNDRKKSFAVYQDTDSVLFDYFVKLSGVFHILKMV